MEKEAGDDSSSSPGPPPVKVKQEPKEDEMKDFAETTMNELLGWYGYDKVDEEDTEGLNLSQFASQNKTPSPATSGGERARPGSVAERLRRSSLSNSSEDSSIVDTQSPGSASDLASQHQALVSALNGKGQNGKPPTPGPDGSAPSGYIQCAWCQKTGLKLFTLKTSSSGTKAFCSELCFTQCRRASFKKNKVCDWCKHVRHTVNFVDFQDGEVQLQFCSDKCLNQYKMNIFCKETQEHLQQIHGEGEESGDDRPASADRSRGISPSSSREGGSRQILITPELWMKNKSRHRKITDASEDDASGREDGPSVEKMAKPSKEMRINLTEEEDVKPRMEKITDSSDHREKTLSLNDRRLKENRDKIRRMRAREHQSMPAPAAHSPASSQVSTSPSVTTSPMGSNAPPGIPLGHPLGALAPGMPPHPLFYQHLMAGGLHPYLPHASMLGMPHHDGQVRPPMVRVTPTPEGSSSTPRAPSQPNTQASPPNHQHPPQPGMPPGPRPPPPHLMPPFPPGAPFPPMPPPGLFHPNPMAGVLPPNTLLMPYPVMVPLPVPIPIVIPVKTDKDLQSLIYKNKEMLGEKPIKIEVSPRAETRSSETKSAPPLRSSFTPASTTPQPQCATPSSVSSENVPPSLEPSTTPKDTITCACCQTQTINNEHCNSRLSSESDNKEACHTPAKTPNDSEYSMAMSGSDMEDCVIDLSKDKSYGNSKEKSSVLNNVDQNKTPTPITIKPIANSEMGGVGPPPMMSPLHPALAPPNGGHLMPPRDHSYSSRRGLILDAPSVPRDRNKSPSPEKRILLRSPSRDMLFGKRRCLRRSIKSK